MLVENTDDTKNKTPNRTVAHCSIATGLTMLAKLAMLVAWDRLAAVAAAGPEALAPPAGVASC